MKVFLSHAALDTELAELIERQLTLGNEQMSVFRTTRLGQIPAGKEWLAVIQQNIRDADAYLVLLTPWSMSRPWINYETGAAWFSERKLVPVVAGDLAKDVVVEPLRSLQLLSLEDPAEATQAFVELGARLGDPIEFSSAVISIAARTKIAALARDDWDGIEFDGKYYAWDGNLEGLAEGQAKPVPEGLTAALENAGLRLTFGIPSNLMNEYSKGYSIVFLVDTKRRRRHMLVGSYSQVLLARPVDFVER